MIHTHGDIVLVEVPDDAGNFRIDFNGYLVMTVPSSELNEDDELSEFYPDNWVTGNYEIIGKASELNESDWRSLIKGKADEVEGLEFGGVWFQDFCSRGFSINSATESGLSLIKSKNLKPETTLILKKIR